MFQADFYFCTNRKEDEGLSWKPVRCKQDQTFNPVKSHIWIQKEKLLRVKI